MQGVVHEVNSPPRKKLWVKHEGLELTGESASSSLMAITSPETGEYTSEAAQSAENTNIKMSLSQVSSERFGCSGVPPLRYLAGAKRFADHPHKTFSHERRVIQVIRKELYYETKPNRKYASSPYCHTLDTPKVAL